MIDIALAEFLAVLAFILFIPPTKEKHETTNVDEGRRP